MAYYNELREPMLSKIKPLAQKLDHIYISNKIYYKDKVFYQIVFRKKSFLQEELRAIAIVDENGDFVKDKFTLKELLKLGYFYDEFFNDTRTSLFTAIQSEGNINREKYDIKMALEGLEFLKKESDDNFEQVEFVLNSIHSMREKNNSKLQSLKNSVEEVRNTDTYGDTNFSKLYDLYVDIMGGNFENIKLMNTAYEFYDDIKITTIKKRKQLTVRFNKKIVNPLIKLEYQMEFFQKILKTYEKVLNMNLSSYKKFFLANEEKALKSREELLIKK